MGNCTELPDPQISWAIYGRLTDPSEIDFYRFEAQAGESLFIQMTIPVIAGLEEFEPSFALVGVGLPSDEAASPTALLSDQGIVTVADDGSPPRLFYESFSGRQYWMRQEVRINAPQTGTYYVLVWHPQGEVGKYVLVVGDVEQRVADRPGVGAIRATISAIRMANQCQIPSRKPCPRLVWMSVRLCWNLCNS